MLCFEQSSTSTGEADDGSPGSANVDKPGVLRAGFSTAMAELRSNIAETASTTRAIETRAGSSGGRRPSILLDCCIPSQTAGCSGDFPTGVSGPYAGLVFE